MCNKNLIKITILTILFMFILTNIIFATNTGTNTTLTDANVSGDVTNSAVNATSGTFSTNQTTAPTFENESTATSTSGSASTSTSTSSGSSVTTTSELPESDLGFSIILNIFIITIGILIILFAIAILIRLKR